MRKSVQYAQLVVVIITAIMVLYMAYSLFTVQQAFAQFGQGMEQVGTEMNDEMTKVQKCLDAAKDNIDAQIKCYG